jgi:Rod binding domain-containing protein
MRSTAKKGDPFRGSRGGELFTGLLDQGLAQAGSLGGRGLGIAGMIEKQVAKNARSAYGG